MDCCRPMVVPIKNGWVRVTRRLRLRKTGHLKLRHDVRACEYEDVRTLWELLKKNQSGMANSTRKTSKRCFSRISDWAKRAPLL